MESENVTHNVQLGQLVDEAMRKKSCGQSQNPSSYANKVKGDSYQSLASGLLNSAKFPALQGGTGHVQMWKQTAVQQCSGATANGASEEPQVVMFRMIKMTLGIQLRKYEGRELWQFKHQQKVQAVGQWHGEPQAQSGGNIPGKGQGVMC